MWNSCVLSEYSPPGVQISMVDKFASVEFCFLLSVIMPMLLSTANCAALMMFLLSPLVQIPNKQSLGFVWQIRVLFVLRLVNLVCGLFAFIGLRALGDCWT